MPYLLPEPKKHPFFFSLHSPYLEQARENYTVIKWAVTKKAEQRSTRGEMHRSRIPKLNMTDIFDELSSEYHTSKRTLYADWQKRALWVYSIEFSRVVEALCEAVLLPDQQSTKRHPGLVFSLHYTYLSWQRLLSIAQDC